MGSYPLYVNVWNREVMDAHRETNFGIEKTEDPTGKLESQHDRAVGGKEDVAMDEIAPAKTS